MVGCGALALRYDQRASFGTQKMLAARYSSGSSGSAPSALLRFELGVLRLERVGDVLEEDQAEDDVLVLGRVHVVAQRVGRLPQVGLEAEVGGGVLAPAAIVLIRPRAIAPPRCCPPAAMGTISLPAYNCLLRRHRRRVLFIASGTPASALRAAPWRRGYGRDKEPPEKIFAAVGEGRAPEPALPEEAAIQAA